MSLNTVPNAPSMFRSAMWFALLITLAACGSEGGSQSSLNTSSNAVEYDQVVKSNITTLTPDAEKGKAVQSEKQHHTDRPEPAGHTGGHR